MIGLDSNVVIRYLVQDDAKQAALATQLLERELSLDHPGMLSNIVLCEIAWVLETRYQQSREAVAQIFEALFASKQIVLEDAQAAWQALRAMQRRAVDFSDALLGAMNHRLGCSHTATFDKQAAKLEQFKLLA